MTKMTFTHETATNEWLKYANNLDEATITDDTRSEDCIATLHGCSHARVIMVTALPGHPHKRSTHDLVQTTPHDARARLIV